MMKESLMTKEEARALILPKRLALPKEFIQEKSQEMAFDIEQDPAFRSCSVLYLYCPIKGEIDTSFLRIDALREGKKVCVPIVIDKKRMAFGEIHEDTPMKPGRFEIPEPDLKTTAIVTGPGLMIVPVVAFEGRRRVGYGSYYYHRYLREHPGIHTIGVAYDFQKLSGILFTAEDDPLDEIRSY
jgi:5-formyltetrahydrofolate cyclo-ligase